MNEPKTQSKKSSQAFRKFISTGIGFIFLVVGITGVIFQFFFKNQVLESIHGWLGVAMVVVAVIHVIQNWKPLRNYLKQPVVYALLVPIILWCAYFALLQKPARGGGFSPRMLIGKLSDAKPTDLAKVFGKDISTVSAKMNQDHVEVQNSEQSLKQIAQANGKEPQALLGYFLR